MSTAYRPLDFKAAPGTYGRKYVWEFPVRLAHWINALALTALFLSGLYMASPILAPNGEAYKNFVTPVRHTVCVGLLGATFGQLSACLGVRIPVSWAGYHQA